MCLFAALCVINWWNIGCIVSFCVRGWQRLCENSLQAESLKFCWETLQCRWWKLVCVFDCRRGGALPVAIWRLRCDAAVYLYIILSRTICIHWMVGRFYFTWYNHSCYPTICSIGRDTKFTVCFSFVMYSYGFVSQGFTVWREILPGGSATSQTGLLLLWGIAPGMAELWALTGAIWLSRRQWLRVK